MITYEKRRFLFIKIIVWPVYIDSERSLKEGRKISKENSVKSPKIGEISRAARKLDFNPITESDKKYPGLWYESSGRIIIEVDEGISKREALKLISEQIKSSR